MRYHRKVEFRNDKDLVKIMATSNVTPLTGNEGIYLGKVTTKTKHPITQEDLKVTGDFKLPMATSGSEALNMVGGSEDDLVFWFNFGRKVAARTVVTQSLGLDFGTEELNDLVKSFSAAMSAMSSDGMSEERKKKIKDFILSEDKFAPIREVLSGWTPDHKSVDFSVVELKKPSGKRGPKGKDDDGE